MNKDIEERLSNEIKSFKDVWKGGYFESEVLDPVGYSTFGPLGYVSSLHALYLMTIKPYINSKTTVLEIGPGRGAFTKAILKCAPREIICLDAKSAEDNKFFEYVGNDSRIKYYQVFDFTCSVLPDEHFDYLFSFGALCHVSFDGIRSYLTNLYPKLKAGAECFIMVADYYKFNSCMNNIENLTIYKNLPFQKLMKFNWRFVKLRYKKIFSLRRNLPESVEPEPGRWYHAGIKETCDLLRSLGYQVVSEDIGIISRDPVIHFRK